MSEQQQYLNQGLAAAGEAARELALCDDIAIRTMLESLADRTIAAEQEILQANRSDLSRMHESDPKYDRLLLNSDRLADIANDLRSVAALPSPVGEVLEQRQLENGLELSKIRVPMGVIAVIFESRPNVTFDVFALCVKTRNACVLKGSSDAHDTNLVIVNLIHTLLEAHGINPAVVFLAPPQREWLPQILQATDTIDLAIPRGSKGLIDFVRDNGQDTGHRNRGRYRPHLCRRQCQPGKGQSHHYQCQDPSGQRLQRAGYADPAPGPVAGTCGDDAINGRRFQRGSIRG